MPFYTTISEKKKRLSLMHIHRHTHRHTRKALDHTYTHTPTHTKRLFIMCYYGWWCASERGALLAWCSTTQQPLHSALQRRRAERGVHIKETPPHLLTPVGRWWAGINVTGPINQRPWRPQHRSRKKKAGFKIRVTLLHRKPCLSLG